MNIELVIKNLEERLNKIENKTNQAEENFKVINNRIDRLTFENKENQVNLTSEIHSLVEKLNENTLKISNLEKQKFNSKTTQ